MAEYGLVLAGGGARGSYEIGVWRALREMNIKITAITGTSVGALNGAVMVQDDFDKAYKLWDSLAIKDVIRFQKEIDSIHDLYKYPIDLFPAIREAIYAGGLDTAPLSKLIASIIDEDKIRNSPIDFGLVTFSLSKLKPIELFKEDIPKGQLIDYLLASSCFPSFRPVEIDDDRFIDGGIYNNVPISLMVQKEIENIIVVDISNNGIPKDVDVTGLNIIHIKPSESVGAKLDFNTKQSRLNMDIGYLDTLRAMGKVCGNIYYIKEIPDRGFRDIYIDYMALKTIYSLLGIDRKDKFLPINRMIISKVYTSLQGNMLEYIFTKKGARIALLISMAEIAAQELKIERKAIYSFRNLNDLMLDKCNKILNTREFDHYTDQLLMSIANIKESDIIDVIINMPVTMGFLPLLLSNPKLKGEHIVYLRRVVAMTMPNISIASIYIYLLMHIKEL
ncbi:MAG: patatin-like phospholipase family protein [Clostridiales bacterium]|nr:patatin-like phospholipase family protein [Clostridiales bacterium]